MSLQGIGFAKSLSKFSIKRLVWPLIWVSGVEKRMVRIELSILNRRKRISFFKCNSSLEDIKAHGLRIFRLG